MISCETSRSDGGWLFAGGGGWGGIGAVGGRLGGVNGGAVVEEAPAGVVGQVDDAAGEDPSIRVAAAVSASAMPAGTLTARSGVGPDASGIADERRPSRWVRAWHRRSARSLR